jgi:hypothetical protein
MPVTFAISRIVGGIGIARHCAATAAGIAVVTAPLSNTRMQNKRYLEVEKESRWGVPAPILQLQDVRKKNHSASEVAR